MKNKTDRGKGNLLKKLKLQDKSTKRLKNVQGIKSQRDITKEC